jgi:Ran GTPase-activating protein (RanGAP) involved in mRNA processing and transport
VDFLPATVAYSVIMSVTGSNSSEIRDLCKRLRANDFAYGSFQFVPSRYIGGCSERECTAVLEALKVNTTMENVSFSMLFKRRYTKRFALVAAEYVESTKTLQTLNLGQGRNQENPVLISHLLRKLSRNTSVTELIIYLNSVRCASVAFQELLTGTRTIKKLRIIGWYEKAFDEVQIAAIESGFANNTTLRDLEFQGWQETDLARVLIALQHHPTLEKIQFSAQSLDFLPSPSGLEVLLRSKDSKVKELILHKVDTRTAGFRALMQELGRNTTITNLAIRESVLSRENVQQLKAVLRRKTSLQSLDLTSCALGSAGLAEISLALYHNTSIKTLDLSNNGLNDIESADVLRKLIRRNQAITSLSLASNFFGGNAAKVRSIVEGVRSNTSLRQLDFGKCYLDNRDVSLLSNTLLSRNTRILELNLDNSAITSLGVRVLVEDKVEAMKTLNKLRLSRSSIGSEGATILADALGRNALPSLKQLHLGSCSIEDDGLVALISALEHNTSLQVLDLQSNSFGERGVLALAESLPNIKGLQQINFMGNKGFQAILPLLLEGFRKNTSLVEVNIDVARCAHREWSRELKYLGHRNRFTPLLKVSVPPDASPHLGIWPRALAKVATEPDVLFHVIHNMPKLVGFAGGSKKRKRNDK